MKFQLLSLISFLISIPIIFGWNYIDNTTELEYQLILNSSYFRTNRADATSTLYNWMDFNLEQMSHKGVPYVEVDLNDILPYSRNSTRFYLTPNGRPIIRHRFGISGNRTRNEVIWKIVDYNGSVTPEYMAPAPQYDYRYKIEFDLSCSSNTTAISSYARMSMNESVIIVTAGDVNTYFPNFTSYYGLNDSYLLYSKKYTQYIKDCDVKIDGDKAEFTVVLNYDNYMDYLNDYLPPSNTRKPEYSIKVDREDTQDWAKAMSNARAVFDYLLFYCPYIVPDNCTETNSFDFTDDDNGSHNNDFGTMRIIILATCGSAVLILILSLIILRIFYGKTLNLQIPLLENSQSFVENSRSSELPSLRSSHEC